jgi:hypothetical protein
MRVTQPFDFAQGREPAERQMGVFRQPQRLTEFSRTILTFVISSIINLIIGQGIPGVFQKTQCRGILK